MAVLRVLATLKRRITRFLIRLMETIAQLFKQRILLEVEDEWFVGAALPLLSLTIELQLIRRQLVDWPFICVTLELISHYDTLQ